ncbi:MAG: ATP-binding protein [Candidatus Hecatellaceae archaeon]
MTVELVVVSGKGGTGKTSIAASLASLAAQREKIVVVDCDVDASNLHLLLSPKVEREERFSGSKLAWIDPEKCTGCGLCEEYCRFNAVRPPRVDEFSCEGCGVCQFICPVEAVKLKERNSGLLYVSTTRYGPMCHARLNPGESNSGKLVALVRYHAKQIASKEGLNLILSDGPPGVGCPTISSLTGANYALLVAEPTASGLHDLRRILSLTRHFKGLKPLAVVNQWDINPEVSRRIEAFCREEDVELLGMIPFDRRVVEAAVNRLPVVEYASDSPASKEIKNIWYKMENFLRP